MCTGNNSVSKTKKTMRRTWVLFPITFFFFLFSFGHYASANIETYDDFSFGSIDPNRWSVHNDHNFFSVGSEGLHASGAGDGSFPRDTLLTLSSYHSFSGRFGAGINFFNFSQSGYTPSSSDLRNPSISLMIGDWGSSGSDPSNPFFLIARAVGPGGNSIGWRKFNADGTLYDRGGQPYPDDSGGLILDYNPINHTLELGYFNSTNPNDWEDSNPTIVKSFSGVTFNGNPRLQIAFTPGGGGTLSVDVGGLYYKELSDTATYLDPVPEPSTMLLLGSGLLGLAGYGRRKFLKK